MTFSSILAYSSCGMRFDVIMNRALPLGYHEKAGFRVALDVCNFCLHLLVAVSVNNR